MEPLEQVISILTNPDESRILAEPALHVAAHCLISLLKLSL